MTENQEQNETTAQWNFDLVILQNQMKIASTQLKMKREPKEELRNVKDAILDGLENDRDHRVNQDEEFRNFVSTKASDILSNLAREVSHDNDYLEVCADYLKAMILYFIHELREKRFSSELIIAMTWCFQPTSSLFQNYFLMSEEEIRKITTKTQQWRAKLEVGQMIDVRVIGDEKGKTKGFLQAQIVEIVDDLISVIFPKSSPLFDKTIDRWSDDIAEFESKTKKDYEWRETVFDEYSEDKLFDINDKYKWEEAHIMDTRTVRQGDREYLEVYIAFRVYREVAPAGQQVKLDENSRPYTGWSAKFDEWIPAYSPRIQPHCTRHGIYGTELNEEPESEAPIDDLFQPMPGHTKVYMVPRPSTCLSEKFLEMMNIFGNMNGFELLLEVLRTVPPGEQIHIDSLAYISTMVTMPINLFHKDWIEENGTNFSKATKDILLNASDQVMRAMSEPAYSQAVSSINTLNSRTMDKEQQQKEKDVLNLEMAKKGLKSELLDRRIQGMKNLNLHVKKATQIVSTAPGNNEKVKFLVDWMTENGVFDIIWNTKNTHLQLVQRSDAIFKEILKAKLLSNQLLEMFFNLSKSDYKVEVFKIINDSAFWMEKDEIDYLFQEIMKTPANKLGLEEITTLSELGKYNKSSGNYTEQISAFFWKIITESDQHNAELVENSIQKVADMVKYWSCKQKLPFFEKLTSTMTSGNSIIPVLELFTKLITDQKSRVTSYNTSTTGTKVYQTTQSATGSTLISRSFNKNGDEESIYNTGTEEEKTAPAEEKDKEMDLKDLLDQVEKDFDLSSHIIKNLKAYFDALPAAVSKNPATLKYTKDKMCILNPKYTHNKEVMNRLDFLKEFAANSSFQIQKVQLQVVYDLLNASPVQTDLEDFLVWCKKACKAQTALSKILDMGEVTTFFTELIAENKLQIASMPFVGFQFLKNHFISANEEIANLRKIKIEKKKKTQQTNWVSSWAANDQKQDDAEEEDTSDFTILIDPVHLINLDLMWKIALESQVEEVLNQAIPFLVNLHAKIDDIQSELKVTFLQAFINKCFELIKNHGQEPEMVKRLILILKTTIQISEQSGTGGVQPHNAILKGELLDRIKVKYMVKIKGGVYYGGFKLQKSLTLKMYSSTTVWDFKHLVAKAFGLSVRYCQFTLPNGNEIDNTQNGLVISELGIKSGFVITVKKKKIQEEIIEAPIVLPDRSDLTPKAKQMFLEWYDLYKNPETGFMDDQSVATFVQVATRQKCEKNDDRVAGLLNKYAVSKDERHIDQAGFLRFYYEAETGTAQLPVRQNIKNHNIRPDLKKLSEVDSEAAFKSTDMPRFTMSANQEQFQTLFNLLERNDETSPNVWELVKMLNTNKQMYMQVLSLKSEIGDHIDWSKVFEDKSLYKQIYKQEIIVAVMEANKDEDMTQRVMIVESYDEVMKKDTTSADQSAQSSAGKLQGEDNDDLKEIRENWAKIFLTENGYKFALDHLLTKNDPSGDPSSQQAELKDIAFFVTLIRVFITAALQSTENQVASAVNLVRKQSSIQDDFDDKQESKPKTEDQLTKLMQEDSIGTELLLNTNFQALIEKLLNLVSAILATDKMVLEQKLIIENALSLIVASIMQENDLLQVLQNYSSQSNPSVKSGKDFILGGLLFCNEEKVRQDFKHALQALCIHLDKSPNNALFYVIGLLGSNFSEISGRECQEFFDLFNKVIEQKAHKDDLIENLGSGSVDSVSYDPEQLLNQIIMRFKESQKFSRALTNEDAEEDDSQAEMAAKQERLMIGLIQLTRKIIASSDKEVIDRVIIEQDLISQIFKEFLFASYFAALDNQGMDIKFTSHTKRKTKKKTQAKVETKSREEAYQLLNQLISSSSFLMQRFLEHNLLPLISTIKKPNTWMYSPPGAASVSERSQQFVGLRNLGCICYMNSMMQQFYMIPALRYNLLCVDDGKDEEIVEYKNEMIDDNMFHQMQKLIAHLELSERQDYNPLGFCFSFKEFDGNPTNVSEQKDAQEFLNVLFDRLENALKPTPRKYLLQGIFGGKTVSQMVCSECGKVKNRLEDYYNLSLTVKDLKSVESSLQKMVDGEIINDYQCSGCNKKVDLSKRTLIAETPNVLILHLQRIVFNFDTFQNDKLNSFMEFPTVLDLKPFSFHEVMGKEGRLKSQQNKEDGEDGGAPTTQINEKQMTEEEIAALKEAEEEAKEPEMDDCFEYKLVGVNVHSGTANFGHYWSYINTKRGADEKSDDPEWILSEKDPWMEFNDSNVSEFDFKDLKTKCFGNKAGAGRSFSMMGDSYGQSGYMLFYERRKKKDIKILVEKENVEEEKKEGVQISHDEKTDEYFKMVDYRKTTENERPNSIFMKVFEDNKKFSFENDIYSQEFFEFILTIMKSIAQINDEGSGTIKLQGFEIGRKVGFEILARCLSNSPQIGNLAEVMIEIAKSDPRTSKGFIEALLEQDDAEVVFEVLLDCSDKQTQRHLGKVIKYMLCQLKMLEKDLIQSQAKETVSIQTEDEKGNSVTKEVQRPQSIAFRFLILLLKQLRVRAARSWRKFDTYLDIIASFALNSAEEIEKCDVQNSPSFDSKSEAYNVGVELYFKNNLITMLGDFVLQEDSPLFDEKDTRPKMGMSSSMYSSYSTQPNFGPILKLIITMISDEEMIAKYPLSQTDKKIVQSPAILKMMMEPGDAADSTDFSEVLAAMSRNDEKVSFMMAESYLKAIQKGNQAALKALIKVRKFLQIDDALKMKRIEWVLGVPQIKYKKNMRVNTYQYGVEMLDTINDELYEYKSAVCKNQNDGLLAQISKARRNRSDENCAIALVELMQICIEDDDVMDYVFKCPAPTAQHARYTDWFFDFAREIQATLDNSSATVHYISKTKQQAISSMFDLEAKFEARKQEFYLFEAKMKADSKETDFADLREDSLVAEVEEIIQHYPPKYLVGSPSGEERVIAVAESEEISARVVECEVEYLASNPNGKFNLSLPNKFYRNPTTYTQLSYLSWKRQIEAAKASEAGDEDTNPLELDIKTKSFKDDCKMGFCVLKVMLKSNASRLVKVFVTLSVADNERKNVVFPVTSMAETVFSNEDKHAFVFLKVDPSKDTWGDIQISVHSEVAYTSSVTTSTSYTATDIGAGTSGGWGNDTSTSYEPQSYGPSYVPMGIGVGTTDVKISCTNCANECDVGQDFCEKCGEPPSGYSNSVQ